MKQAQVLLNINGNKYKIKVSSTETLADVIREKLGLTGTKIMCDNGECGACTVLVDNIPMLSCTMLAIECEGLNITTIEGLAASATGSLHPVQQTFVERSGMQCGICSPGMILASKALLDENPNPNEDEVREALSGNLCRCGNYKRITECVLAAAEIINEGKKHAR